MPAPVPELPLDKKSASIRSMFADIAPRYDLLNHLLSLNVDRYWRWRTTRLVPPDLSGPHLDVCTGTGDLALAYHRAGKGKLPVVATDFCAPMLVRGNAKDRVLPPVDSDEFIFLARRVGYTTDDWQAGARHLQTDIGQHMTLTKEFFERTFGKV